MIPDMTPIVVEHEDTVTVTMPKTLWARYVAHYDSDTTDAEEYGVLYPLDIDTLTTQQLKHHKLVMSKPLSSLIDTTNR